MLSEIINFVKNFFNKNFNDIILIIVIIMLIMLSFASGYIIAKQQSISPIQIEQTNK